MTFAWSCHCAPAATAILEKFLGLSIGKLRFYRHRPAFTLDQRSTAMKSDSDREIAIFTEALKVSLQERAAFLERACEGEEDLRRKVEALLKAHDRMGDFLQEPPTGGFIE
jgi:hypothetical protein